MFKYSGLVALAFVAVAIERWFGPIGLTRLFGALWVLLAMLMTFTPKIPFYAGQHYVCTITGWKRIFLVMPCLALGLVFIFYAPEVTCFPSKYKHLCA